MRRTTPAIAVLLLLPFLAALPVVAADREDILLADFEGNDYGEWTADGEAFGSRPARGTLPGQMHVGGYRGDGLVNSFNGGDGTTGTLTSPAIRIERRYLSFLIGGGGWEGETCIELRVDGQAVRTATGPNTQPGGSEELTPWAWDLTDLAGRTATLVIVDARKGGWGHINIDHIVLTDVEPQVPERPGHHERAVHIGDDARYLLIPIRGDAPMTRIDLRAGDRAIRQFDAELARTADDVDFWAHLDVASLRGQSVALVADGTFEESLALVQTAASIPLPDDLYDEALRPQLRFSQRLGWNNDPNGMVYLAGEWHLYFQHNPYGWRWGNMHWGHAVSRDLVHWEELPIAIYNARRGDWAFSGGAVVDERNTAGWQTGDEKVIVASWTSTGRGECIAYSNDRGRTFTEYDGNPVVEHRGRDPKIVWYAPGEHWVMAVYDEHEGERWIAFHSSKDLKHWTLESRLRGYFECPELLELPVDGDANDARWVVFAADAQYAIGSFDGKAFTPLHDGKHRVHWGDYYASQVFSNAPDGRRVQIGWARIEMPGMPFNQAFTVPHELTLRTTEDGVRLFAEPVREFEALRGARRSLASRELASGAPAELAISGELFDVEAEFRLGGATSVALDIGGNRITYDAKANKLNGADLEPTDGTVTIRAIVDRPLLEIIGGDGRVYITARRPERGEVSAIRAVAEGDGAALVRLEAWTLRSIWR